MVFSGSGEQVIVMGNHQKKSLVIGKTVDGFYYARPKSWECKIDCEGYLVDGDCLVMSENFKDILQFVDSQDYRLIFNMPTEGKIGLGMWKCELQRVTEDVLGLPRFSLLDMPSDVLASLICRLLRRK